MSNVCCFNQIVFVEVKTTLSYFYIKKYFLSFSFQVLHSGAGGNHGEAVAMSDAGGCHGSEGTDLSKALRMSNSVAQPGNPLC